MCAVVQKYPDCCAILAVKNTGMPPDRDSSAGLQWVLSGWVSREAHVPPEFILKPRKGHLMNNIVYIVGAIVIIIAILSFFGLR